MQLASFCMLSVCPQVAAAHVATIEAMYCMGEAQQTTGLLFICIRILICWLQHMCRHVPCTQQEQPHDCIMHTLASLTWNGMTRQPIAIHVGAYHSLAAVRLKLLTDVADGLQHQGSSAEGTVFHNVFWNCIWETDCTACWPPPQAVWHDSGATRPSSSVSIRNPNFESATTTVCPKSNSVCDVVRMLRSSMSFLSMVLRTSCMQGKAHGFHTYMADLSVCAAVTEAEYLSHAQHMPVTQAVIRRCTVC